MTKFEHMTLRFEVGDNHILRVFEVNGAEIRDWKRGPDVVTYLNQLGAQGWEVVTAAALRSAYPTTLILKRKLSD